MRTARTLTASLAALVAGGALLTGCSTGGDESTGEGLPFGASKEDYIAAFEDVDPITIRMQTEGTEGTLGAIGREKYAEALEEWSGGKITVEMGYSNAFVPNALEWADGLADGRLDIALALPSYQPEIFPLYTELATATVLDRYTSTAALITTGWVGEIGYTDDYLAEFNDNGLQPLIPQTLTYAYTTLFCSDEYASLDDFAGTQISASGRLKSAEVTALGATPVAMPFTDQFEALQRGVIGCALTSTGAVEAGGLAPLTPWGVFDPNTAWEAPVSSLTAGKDFWDGLPLVAQQLVFDRLDVFMSAEQRYQGERQSKVVEDLKAAGGGVYELDDDALDAVNAANEVALDELSGIDTYREASERWTDLVVDELDYGDQGFAEWIEDEGYLDRDMDAYIDRFFEDVLLPHRPGGSD